MLFPAKRQRTRNAIVGLHEMVSIVQKLADKFSAFPDFKAALDTQYRKWRPKQMPSPEDIGGYICRGKVVEEVHRRPTQEPCLTVDQQNGPPGGLFLRGRARIPCPNILGHGIRTRPINTITGGGPFATWSRSTVRHG